MKIKQVSLQSILGKEKPLLKMIYIVSALVFITVTILFNLPPSGDIPAYVKWLPRLNAVLNATCSVLLIVSFIYIKKKKWEIHKRLNITAFMLSALFLLSYVLFHSYGIKTSYPEDNPLRPLYLFILLSHIILAATVLPVVLISFYRGLNMQVEKHRKIVRWSFPLWLYVTISGVIVYLMISPYYKF